MRQKENRPGAGDAYGTVPFNCINDITDMSEFQDLTYNGLLKAVTDDYRLIRELIRTPSLFLKIQLDACG